LGVPLKYAPIKIFFLIAFVALFGLPFYAKKSMSGLGETPEIDWLQFV
jgi:hypothetical protein